MSSTTTLLDNFLGQFYNVSEISTRVLSGHERLVKESRDSDFMSLTFASDENPNWRWYSAMSGSDPDWHMKRGSSWIFGRHQELKNYRRLLADRESGLLTVWSSPKHMPSLGTSVEVWRKGAVKSELLPWQEVLTDRSRVNSVITNLTAKDGIVLFRGYHDVIEVSKKNILRKMGRRDDMRNCDGLFRAGKKGWRQWDLSLLIRAIDATECLQTDEALEAIKKAINYRWRQVPDEVVTDSALLKSLFPSWEKVDSRDVTSPVIFLSDRLTAEAHLSSELKPLLLVMQPLGGISSKKLLSSLRISSKSLRLEEDAIAYPATE